MSSGLSKVFLAVAGLFLASSASASSLTPDLAMRPGAQSLARYGDFDGDGRRDTLVLADDDGIERLAVHVHLNTVDGVRDIRLTTVDSPGNDLPALRIAPAGVYAGDCGTGVSDCSAVKTRSDSVVLALGSGASVLIHWNGASFDTDFIRDDQAEMARTLSALFALNP